MVEVLTLDEAYSRKNLETSDHIDEVADRIHAVLLVTEGTKTAWTKARVKHELVSLLDLMNSARNDPKYADILQPNHIARFGPLGIQIGPGVPENFEVFISVADIYGMTLRLRERVVNG